MCSSCLLASILLGFNVGLPVRAGISHWVKRPTEKPGVILTRVRLPGAARDFLSESAFSADSLKVSVQPPCAVACIKICVQVKNPKHRQPYHCCRHTKILHTLIGMGSAALAAALPYPGTATRITHKGRRSTEKLK